MTITTKIGLLTGFIFTTAAYAAAPVNNTKSPDVAELTIDINTIKSIKGLSKLDRKKYFNLSDPGTQIENVINNQPQVERYLNDYQISFGRQLGLVKGQAKWAKTLVEDPQRPGFMDIDAFKQKVKVDFNGSAQLQQHFSANMDVAAHESHNAYPEFMPMYASKAHPKELFPVNHQAAAEMVSHILRYAYNDFSRPATYEIVNEPHWSHWQDQKLADLHLAVWQQAKADKIPTLIGGPCIAIPYFYKKDYQHLNAITGFIDNTQAKLDFYSFHTYDFLEWDEAAHDFTGRVTSGLPIEGVIDAIQTYTVNQFGKEVKLVFSEHGGYLLKEHGNYLNDKLASQLIGAGSGFEWELKKRSIGNYIMVDSAIGNVMAFMNNPHIIQKSVPFILLQSYNWDPKYYSSLLVADKFSDKNKWVETELIYFYQFFADLAGERVYSESNDPDIQQHAFIEGNKLHIVMRNQSTTPQQVTLNFNVSEKTNSNNFNAQPNQLTTKRFGRNHNFTPYLTIQTEDLNQTVPEQIVLAAKESVMLTFSYPKPIQPSQKLNQVPYYAKQNNLTNHGKTDGKLNFELEMAEYKQVAHAQLRISLGRQANLGKQIEVWLNDKALNVELEDSANTFSQAGKEYGTTKLIKVDPSLLKLNNHIQVRFADGKAGGVGSVVIRAALTE